MSESTIAGPALPEPGPAVEDSTVRPFRVSVAEEDLAELRNTLGFFDVKGATVPAAVSVFPRELYQAPRSWAERAYPNLIYFNELDEGNHFAAWQEPELFTTELRAAFRSLREGSQP